MNYTKHLKSLTLAAVTAAVLCPFGAFAADVQQAMVDTKAYPIPYAGQEEVFNHNLYPGYGSSLTLKQVNADGSLDFYTVTDRGPNADAPTYVKDGKKTAAKIFPTPAFTPNIGVLHVNAQRTAAAITQQIPLKVDGQPISGKVLPKGMTGATGEVALDFTMKDIGNDPNGLDTEGIGVDKNGHFWISDEYGPFIIEADQDGNILRKFGPGMGLPNILASRVPNRGAEGLTIDEKGNIVALMQSPLDVDGKTKKTAPYTRIIVLNPETGVVTMYAYPIDTGYKNCGAAKLGDITSIGNNQFLVIEQGKQNKKMQNLVYKIDLTGATPIPANGALELGNLADFQPVQKSLVLDLRKVGWNIEKAEGLTLLPDRRTLAVVNDNDFGIAVKVTDPQAAKSDVEDYTYDSNAATYTYKDGSNHKAVSLSLTQNAPEEQQNQIWFFTLPEKL